MKSEHNLASPDHKRQNAATDMILNLPEGCNLRMMMYSHDTFGLGHLQRCLKISRALTAAMPNLSILIVTGSPVVHRFELPPRVDYIKLPAVRKIGPETYEARSLSTPYEQIIRLRQGLLLETVKEYKPHLLLVDHSPSGMKGEMLPALEWIGQSGLPCVRMLGLRDIIDDAASVRSLWREKGIYELLRSSYDVVLVYGPREIFDPVKAYALPGDIGSKVRYCNYLGEDEIKAGSESRTAPGGKKRVVVTIGGGDGATEILGTYLEMVEIFREKIDFDSFLVTGPFVDDESFARLEQKAKELSVRLEKFVPSTSPYFAASDLVVSTAGYNTITQVLSHAQRALVIPRVLYRDEQLIRATLLAGAGWIDMVHPDELTATLLFEKVSRLLNSPREGVAEARRQHAQMLTGASHIVAVVAQAARTVTLERERSHE